MDGIEYTQRIQELTNQALSSRGTSPGDVIVALELLKLDVRDMIKAAQAHTQAKILTARFIPKIPQNGEQA